MKRCAIALLAITAACSQTKDTTAEDREEAWRVIAQWNAVGAPLQQKMQDQQKKLSSICDKFGKDVDETGHCKERPAPKPAEKKK